MSTMVYNINGTIIHTTIKGDQWQTTEGYTISRSKKTLKGAWIYTVFAPEEQRSVDGHHRKILYHSASSLKRALSEIARDMKKHRSSV